MGMRGYREAAASIALEAAPHLIKQGTQEGAQDAHRLCVAPGLTASGDRNGGDDLPRS